MSQMFDPYHKWLGIPPSEQPPNYYRLLGVEIFEPDAEVISSAADRQMAYVKSFQNGPHAALTQRLLGELTVARLCLLKLDAKTCYDAELRARLMPVPPPTPASAIPRPIPLPLHTAMPFPVPSGAFGTASLPVDRSLGEPTFDDTSPLTDVSSLEQATALVSLSPSTPENPRAHRRRGSLSAAAHMWWLAGGALAAGLVLGWMIGRIGGHDPALPLVSAVGSSRKNPGTPKNSSVDSSGSKGAKSAVLRKVERPRTPLGVTAEKVVLWNAHNGPHNNVGTKKFRLRLFAEDREVWKSDVLDLPWEANKDLQLSLDLPNKPFDRLRVEVSEWHGVAPALAEVQVFHQERNLARGRPAWASGEWDWTFPARTVTDGITSSGREHAGYWIHSDLKVPCWLDVDLSVPAPDDAMTVEADKVVLVNQHNNSANDRGSRECSVSMRLGDREVWKQEGVIVPWNANADREASLSLPKKQFNRLRVTVTKWEKNGGGLCEVKVLGGGTNLARSCGVEHDAYYGPQWRPSRINDGLENSRTIHGYWLTPDRAPAWVELDLSCNHPRCGPLQRQVGELYCFEKGDWTRGLPWLAQGDDLELRTLAQLDLGKPGDGAELVALAEGWSELADRFASPYREQILGRAAICYVQAALVLPEYARAQANRRLSELRPLFPGGPRLWLLPETEVDALAWPLRNVRIVVGGVHFPYGFMMHPHANQEARAAFVLGGKYRRLRGGVGINDSVQQRCASGQTFRILGDGRKLWSSRPLQTRGESQAFDVDISQIHKLELIVSCAGPNHWAHAVWLDPLLE